MHGCRRSPLHLPPVTRCRAWESRYEGLDIFSSLRLMGCSCGNGMVKGGLQETASD